jgi:hypothetical protein
MYLCTNIIYLELGIAKAEVMMKSPTDLSDAGYSILLRLGLDVCENGTRRESR